MQEIETTATKRKCPVALVLGVILLIASAIAAYLIIRGKLTEPAPAEPEERPSRLEDPVYRAQLGEQQKGQREIFAERARIQAELDAALVEDPDGTGEKVRKLRAELDANVEALKANREQTMAIVRQKVLSEAATDINNRNPKAGKGN